MMHSRQNLLRCHRYSPFVDELEFLEVPGMMEEQVGHSVLGGISHLQGAILPNW